jgi:hypothetical protein
MEPHAVRQAEDVWAEIIEKIRKHRALLPQPEPQTIVFFKRFPIFETIPWDSWVLKMGLSNRER